MESTTFYVTIEIMEALSIVGGMLVACISAAAWIISRLDRKTGEIDNSIQSLATQIAELRTHHDRFDERLDQIRDDESKVQAKVTVIHAKIEHVEERIERIESQAI